MKKLATTFSLKRETKGALVLEEEGETLPDIIGTLYLKKWAAAYLNRQGITRLGVLIVDYSDQPAVTGDTETEIRAANVLSLVLGEEE